MFNLINEIDDFLLKEENRIKKGHNPSDVLSCIRQLWYKWQNVPKSDPPEPGALLKMQMGHIIHGWVYNVLQKKGFELVVENEDVYGQAKEFLVPGLDYPIRYRIDSLFTDPEGVKSIIEVKSSYGMGIKEIQMNGPKDSDYAQGLMYQIAENITRVYYVYIGRDNGYRTQHVQNALMQNDNFDIVRAVESVKIDGILITPENERYKMKMPGGNSEPITFGNIVNKLKFIESVIIKDDLPERSYTAPIKNGEIVNKFQSKGVIYKCWQCNYCAWKNKCWSEELKKYSHSNNSDMFEGKEGWEEK